jgi:hypothetical protein
MLFRFVFRACRAVRSYSKDGGLKVYVVHVHTVRLWVRHNSEGSFSTGA